MVVRLSPSGTIITVNDEDILGGPLGTMKGTSVLGPVDVLADLTGEQQAACWRRGPQVDVSNVSGTVDLDLTVPTTLLRIRTTGNAILRSMRLNSPNPQNQELVIIHERQSGSGFLTLPQNMAGAVYAPFFNSNRKPIVLGDVSGYLARGVSGFWRGNDTTSAPIPLSVTLPVLAAGVLGYVDVTLVGTPLEGTPANSVVYAQPQTDLAAAGADNGFYVNCRMSALNTLRFTFVGTLASSAVTFTVSSP